MKHFLFALFIFSGMALNAQHEHLCAKTKQTAMATRIRQQARTANTTSLISHENKYDLKFVHLNLNLERTTKYVSGNVMTVARVTALALDTFMTLLHENHTIDSILFNGVSLPFTRADSAVKVALPIPLPANSTFTATVYYKGLPPNGGAAIGSGFSNATSGAWNTQATWSLSESFVGYHWWPCKQTLTDKIDSSWVYVTTDSTNKVGSNGLLKNVVTIGNKKRYEWQSRTPIAYYLISVAVSKYREYNLYAKPLYLPNDSILIQNYIYANAFTNAGWTNTQKVSLDQMPEVLEFLCGMYGMYPFHKEKYGHSMAPFSGGMEHQTMTSLGFFDYYLNAHELGHQWWGDNVTCKTWSDIWINEGFASYTEHLVAQYLDPPNFMTNLNSAHTSVMSQSGGSVFFTGADTLDSGVIFDGRLTYDKGGAIIRSLQFLTNNDSLWFNTLRGFQNTYKNSNASVVDFKTYYEAQTGINATQFFNQWYYGEGYPTYTLKYNTAGNTCVIKSTQSGSMPGVTPLFIGPVEFKIYRNGAPDTTVRVIQTNSVEVYSFNLTGTVTTISCDPNNWLINKVVGPTFDGTLSTGIREITNDSPISAGPNPTKGTITISGTSDLEGKAEILDLQGKLITSRALSAPTTLDVSHCANGVYVLKIVDKDGEVKHSQKIVKQ